MDVAELTEAFKDQAANPNHALLMQRVQELMGQGIDVSTFFATMVSVSPPYFSICSTVFFSSLGYLSQTKKGTSIDAIVGFVFFDILIYYTSRHRRATSLSKRSRTRS